MARSPTILTLLLNAVLIASLCYYPDSSISPHDVPCRSDINATCCGNGFACMTNGLCQSTTDSRSPQDYTQYLRGSCTDKSFTSAECSLLCMNPELDNISGGQPMQKCANQPGDTYVCWSDQSDSDCSNQLDLIMFEGEPSAITTIGVTQTSSSSTASATSTTSASKSISSTAAATAPSSSSTSPQPDAGPPSYAVAVGVGAGVGGGGVLAIFVVFFVWRQKRSRKAHDQHNKHTSAPPPYSGEGGYSEAPKYTHEAPADNAIHELDPQRAQELQGVEQRHELPA